MSTQIRSVALLACLPAALLGCPGGKDGEGAGATFGSLGTFTTDTGGSVDVPLTVEEGTASALLYCGPYTYDIIATAESMTDPAGAMVYDFNDPLATPMRVLNHDDMLPVLIPVSPDLPLTAGDWVIRLYVDSPSPVTVECGTVTRSQEPSAGQTVDLRFVFVGVDGEVPQLNAAEGHVSELLTSTVERVNALWAGAGVSVGEISYEDFSGDVATYNSVDGATEFGNLLRTAPPNGLREITYFFVSAITDDDGATILGLAGGPPGIPMVGGTSKSGVVVTVGALADADTDLMARIMAHEGMHFMGLFHPTEKAADSFDPLGDTPECTTDGDGDGTYTAAECAGQGADNLMWWSASSTSTELSADQAWVVQRSAAAQ